MTDYIFSLSNGQCVVAGLIFGIFIGITMALAAIRIAKMFIVINE